MKTRRIYLHLGPRSGFLFTDILSVCVQARGKSWDLAMWPLATGALEEPVGVTYDQLAAGVGVGVSPASGHLGAAGW
jgi:hypothetical protein